MRKLFFILSMFLMLYACNDAPSYTITGQISTDSMDGQKVYLENYLWYLKMSDKKTLDSALVQGKKFEFKGKTDSSYIALLTNNNRPFVMVFVEQGNIKVDVPEDISKAEALVTGTKLNDLYQLFNKSMEPTKNKINELIQYVHSQEMTEAFKVEINSKYDELLKEMLQVSVKFLNENPGTILSAQILLSAMSQGAEPEIIQDVYDKLEQSVKDGALGNMIRKQVERTKIKELAEGEKFRDLTFETPEGKKVSISDYAGKGKYVLLDFWASWCGPCRAENPNIVNLYKEYKDKGFEIVGVSLDDDKSKWIKGIEDDGITWPQMSDLKGWESEAAIAYKVLGIPFTVLLDKEGIVIAINLRGEELKNKIKTLIQ